MIKKVFLYTFLVVFAFGIGILSTKAIFASEDYSKVKQTKILKAGSLDNSLTEYVALKENDSDKEIDIEVNFKNKHHNKNDFKNYKENMDVYSNKLNLVNSENMPIGITFNRTLSVDEVLEFAKKYNITLKESELRYIDENGLRSTLFWPHDNPKNIVFNEENIKKYAANYKEIKGVYMIRGELNLDKTKYNNISNNKNVYLVDISHRFIEKELQDTNEIKANSTTNTKLDINLPNNIFWTLEDLGEVN